MAREILFRGKRMSGGKWAYGTSPLDVVVPSGRNATIMYGVKNKDTLEVYEVNPDTVGQYTGLTDKNGVKVFEGDIIHIGGRNIPYKVIWHDTGLKGKAIRASDMIGLCYWIEAIEVIGNIHEQEAQNET